MGLSLVGCRDGLCDDASSRAGSAGLGVIAPGATADLVVLDRDLNVVHTFLAGALVWSRLGSAVTELADRRESDRFGSKYVFPRSGERRTHRTVYCRMKAFPGRRLLAADPPGRGCTVTLDSSRRSARDEKRFTVTGTPTVHLTTFDGAIEIQSWDKPDVLVEVEKRGATKEAVDGAGSEDDRRTATRSRSRSRSPTGDVAERVRLSSFRQREADRVGAAQRRHPGAERRRLDPDRSTCAAGSNCTRATAASGQRTWRASSRSRPAMDR